MIAICNDVEYNAYDRDNIANYAPRVGSNLVTHMEQYNLPTPLAVYVCVYLVVYGCYLIHATKVSFDV